MLGLGLRSPLLKLYLYLYLKFNTKHPCGGSNSYDEGKSLILIRCYLDHSSVSDSNTYQTWDTRGDPKAFPSVHVYYLGDRAALALLPKVAPYVRE